MNKLLVFSILLIILVGITIAQLTGTTKKGTEGKYEITLDTKIDAKSQKETVINITITNVNQTKGSNSIWDMYQASKTYQDKVISVSPKP